MKGFAAGVVRWGALNLAAGCAAAGLAGQLARFDIRLDFVNHLAPFWFFGSVIALALWALVGRTGRATPILAAIGAAAGLLMCGPEWAHAVAPQRAAPASETVKIIQLNVWGANERRDDLVRWLIAEDADFVVLEEVGPEDPRIWERIAGTYPHLGGCHDPRACSIVIASKRAPIEGAVFQSTLRRGDLGGWARYPSAKGDFVLAAGHMPRPFPFGAQDLEMRTLSWQVNDLASASTILAGDFNATPWSVSLKRFDASLSLSRRTRALTSWPTRSRDELGGLLPPLLPIDHVYAGPDWRTVEVRRGPNVGSDHFPVVVTLTR